MSKILVYNTKLEDHTSDCGCNFYIGRTKNGNPLSNPFTFNGVKSKLAELSFKTREEAIKAYADYFDKMYGKDEELTKSFDEIYQHYKNGENIYLQCFCKPMPCHGDVLADRLQRKLIKEKIAEKMTVTKAKNNNTI